MVLEKAKLRLEHNSAKHSEHVIETAIGLVSGPISDKHR